MGMKYVKELRKAFRQRPSFSLGDVRRHFQDGNLSPAYAKLMMHHLVRRGQVHRLVNGVYTFLPEMQVVGSAFQPYYYGLQDALSFHGLWEQETNPVVITPRRVRPGLRVFLGNNYVVRRIDRSFFFGFDLMAYGDFWIYVSDVEKTLIDFCYFREPLEKTSLAEIREKTDTQKMERYLSRCPKWLGKRVRQKLQ